MIVHNEDEFDMHAYMASVLLSTHITKSNCKQLQEEQQWKTWDTERWKEVCSQTVKEMLYWDVAVSVDKKVVDFIVSFKSQINPTLNQTHVDLLRYWQSQGIDTHLCPRPSRLITTKELLEHTRGQRSLSARELKKFTDYMQNRKKGKTI